MRQVTLDLPELGLIAATRGALGAGIALLLADHLEANTRRAVGWTLFAVGALSTFPLVAHVFSQSHSMAHADGKAELFETASHP